MNAKLFLFSLGIAGGVLRDSKAYVYGYKRIYRESTNTTVDLLYDIQIPVPDLTTEEFCALSCEEAKKKLYPTEQKILNFLQEWEKNGYACDLIWESAASKSSYTYYYPPVTPCFLGLDTFFGLTSMKSLTFIPSNMHRTFGFFSLFEVLDDQGKRKFDYKEEGGELKYGYNATHCSFEDPAPLSSLAKRDILRYSGVKTWHQFHDLRSRVIKDIQSYYSVSYSTTKKLSYTKDFLENPRAYALCDIEILSHVLASQALRVIVYADGAHCLKVSEFLEQNGFSCLYEALPKDKSYRQKSLPVYPELSLDYLNFFEDPPYEYAPLHRRLCSYMKVYKDKFIGT